MTSSLTKESQDYFATAMATLFPAYITASLLPSLAARVEVTDKAPPTPPTPQVATEIVPPIAASIASFL